MYEVKNKAIADRTVALPGSKSYTHRYLIAAALADGVSVVRGGLDSEDTRFTRRALESLGAVIEPYGSDLRVHGTRGRLRAVDRPIDIGNSGTTMRLMTAVAALASGSQVLTGSERMQQRPIGDLLEALQQAGVSAVSVNGNGCPPVATAGGPVPGGPVSVDCRTSSQFLSALLLIAPYCLHGLDIRVVEGPVSRPYVDLTLQVMTAMGIVFERDGYERFAVPGAQVYRSGDFTVEPDASQASYFWAAAAVTGRAVTVSGLHRTSLQGDVRFVDVLERMGCSVSAEAGGLTVCGGALRGVDVDMADMPDVVPTLAVVAAFARGETVIRNVAHLKAKESDRLDAVTRELRRMGVGVRLTGDGLRITGGAPAGALIETYQDHRMAMSFAVAGLRTPGVRIRDEGCVAKSFPRFWDVFETLYLQ